MTETKQKEKSAEEKQKLFEQLKEWVEEQPHTPTDLPDKLIWRFLHSCYYDLEKAQKAIESFSSLRATSPEIFANRDMHTPEFQKALKISKFAGLKISGSRTVWIKQLLDPGLLNYDHVNDARLFLLIADAWFLEDDEPTEQDVVIMDMKDITWRIFMKLNMSVAKKMGKYQEEAMPIRLKQVHLINAPSFVDKLFSLMRHFLKQDLSELVHCHAPNSETLFDFISRDELPEDFGGNLASMEVLTEKAVATMRKHWDILSKEDLWTAPEKKVKKKKKAPSPLPSPIPTLKKEDLSSFRSLAID